MSEVSEDFIFDTEATPMLTPSDVVEYLFCPRFTYYLNYLKIPQHEEKRYLVLKGREVHNSRAKRNVDYLRKRLGCVKKEINVYLAAPSLRVRGVVDEVLTLSDGTMAPLDYKYTEYHEYLFRTHRYQSVLYGMLIAEIYRKPVNRGFVCYVREGAALKEVVYTPEDFHYILKVIDEIFRIIQKGYYPEKGSSYPARCVDCCYKNICV